MRNLEISELLHKFYDKKALLSAQIAITNRCNENCVHCLRQTDTEHELTLVEIKDIILQLAKEGATQLIITGGEAFLRDDLFVIAHFAKKQGFAIRLFSNGTLLNEKNIKLLKSLLPAIKLQVSLYGMTAKVHEKTTRVRGSFEKTFNAVRLLKKHKIPLDIAMIIMRHNFHELAQLKKKCKIKGWRLLSDFIIRPTYMGSKEPLRLRATDEQIKHAYRYGLLSFKRNTKKSDERTLFMQRLGLAQCYISSQGKLYLSALTQLKLGDLRKDSLHRIWTGSDKVKWLRSLKPSDFECFRCKHYSRCCWEPGLAFAEYGDFLRRPREHCRVQHINRLKQIDENFDNINVANLRTK